MLRQPFATCGLYNRARVLGSRQHRRNSVPSVHPLGSMSPRRVWDFLICELAKPDAQCNVCFERKFRGDGEANAAFRGSKAPAPKRAEANSPNAVQREKF